jgi:hypothetical protein
MGVHGRPSYNLRRQVGRVNFWWAVKWMLRRPHKRWHFFRWFLVHLMWRDTVNDRQ